MVRIVALLASEYSRLNLRRMPSRDCGVGYFLSPAAGHDSHPIQRAGPFGLLLHLFALHLVPFPDSLRVVIGLLACTMSRVGLRLPGCSTLAKQHQERYEGSQSGCRRRRGSRQSQYWGQARAGRSVGGRGCRRRWRGSPAWKPAVMCLSPASPGTSTLYPRAPTEQNQILEVEDLQLKKKLSETEYPSGRGLGGKSAGLAHYSWSPTSSPVARRLRTGWRSSWTLQYHQGMNAICVDWKTPWQMLVDIFSKEEEGK